MLSLLLTVLLTSHSNASAGLLPASQLSHVECKGSEGEFFRTSLESPLVEASIAELPGLSSVYTGEEPDVGFTTWVKDKLYGFGGMTSDVNRGPATLVTVLFTAEQMKGLPSEGAFVVHFAGTSGMVFQREMSCSLSFRQE